MREQRRGGVRFRSLLEFIRRRSFSRHYRGKPQIRKAREETEHVQQDAEEEAAGFRALEDEFDDPGKPQRKHVIKNPERVLVRLKVEHTGFTTLNNQRFGSQFVGQVVSVALVIYGSFSSPRNTIFNATSIDFPPHRHVSLTVYAGQSFRHSTLPQASPGRDRQGRQGQCLEEKTQRSRIGRAGRAGGPGADKHRGFDH